MSHSANEQPFLSTETSEKILGTFELGWGKNKPIVVIGPPGIGKTHTIDKLKSDNHEVIIITTLSSTGSEKSIYDQILNRICSYRDTRSRIKAGMLTDIETELESRSNLWTSDVLPSFIFDEAQNMDLEAMRNMLELHKKWQVNVAFVGNSSTLKRKGVSIGDLMQITDRIPDSNILTLSGITIKDIEVIAMHREVTGVDAFNYVKAYALGKSLRKLENLLEDARLFAGMAGPICLSHLREAMKTQLGKDVESGIFKLSQAKAA